MVLQTAARDDAETFSADLLAPNTPDDRASYSVVNPTSAANTGGTLSGGTCLDTHDIIRRPRTPTVGLTMQCERSVGCLTVRRPVSTPTRHQNSFRLPEGACSLRVVLPTGEPPDLCELGKNPALAGQEEDPLRKPISSKRARREATAEVAGVAPRHGHFFPGHRAWGWPTTPVVEAIEHLG